MLALILIVLAVLVLALLLFPVTISFDSTGSGGEIDGSLSVSWIFFLFKYALKEKQLDVLIFGRRMFHRRSPEEKKIESEPEKERKSRIPGRMSGSGSLQIIGPLLRLFKDFVSSFRLKYFDIDVTFGHSDPAFIGILTGFMHAVRSSFRIGQNIRFAPDFTRSVLDWNLRTNATITPIRMLIPFVRFAANRKVLSVTLQNITQRS